MNRLWKTLMEAGVMLAGLILVLITLSGTTRQIGIVCTVASLIMFVLSSLVPDDD